MHDELVGLMNAFQVSLGLLLLSVGAATSLAEERVRGSLDVLLSTPMSTRSILAGKWWGSFRARLRHRDLAGRDDPCFLAYDRGSLGRLRAAARPGAGLRRGDHQPGPGGGDVGGRLGRAVALCVTTYVLFADRLADPGPARRGATFGTAPSPR